MALSIGNTCSGNSRVLRHTNDKSLNNNTIKKDNRQLALNINSNFWLWKNNQGDSNPALFNSSNDSCQRRGHIEDWLKMLNHELDLVIDKTISMIKEKSGNNT